MRAVLFAFVVVPVVVFPVAIVAQAVLDLNFIGLAEAVQEYSFLAVAFYSPGCGHCRRLLPSWTKAAERLMDQNEPIRLARMDIASRGGMGAWKAFGLQRVPAVKVFVGNVEEPTPYRGHLDAAGIADHLSMLHRDRRRQLEREDRLGRSSRPRESSGGVNRNIAHQEGTSPPELEGSGVMVVALSSPVPDASGSAAAPSLAFRERCVEAVGKHGLSLVLFVSKESPKFPRMLKELRKAAPLLADSDPPVRVVLVDLRVPSEIGNPASRRGTKKRAGSSSYGAGVEPADASTRAFMTEVGGAPLGDAPELRVFLDGKSWIDGGTFRGMPTADGIRRHMQWVAGEADLLSPTHTQRAEGDKKDEHELAAITTAADGNASTSQPVTAVVDISVIVRGPPATTNEASACIVE